MTASESVAWNGSELVSPVWRETIYKLPGCWQICIHSHNLFSWIYFQCVRGAGEKSAFCATQTIWTKQTVETYRKVNKNKSLTSWKRANTGEEVNKWPDSELTPMSTQLGGEQRTCDGIKTKVGSEQSAVLYMGSGFCKYGCGTKVRAQTRDKGDG